LLHHVWIIITEQSFDDDLSFQDKIFSQENGPHTTGTYLLHNLVFIVEDNPDLQHTGSRSCRSLWGAKGGRRCYPHITCATTPTKSDAGLARRTATRTGIFPWFCLRYGWFAVGVVPCVDPLLNGSMGTIRRSRHAQYHHATLLTNIIT